MIVILKSLSGLTSTGLNLVRVDTGLFCTDENDEKDIAILYFGRHKNLLMAFCEFHSPVFAVCKAIPYLLSTL